jgi:hypothetical protein
MLLDNEEFYNEIKQSIITKIKQTEIKVNEEVTIED